MIENKDWKVVLGWDVTKVKAGLKNLDTMMKRVEKTNSRIVDRKSRDEDRAWAQHKKQLAAKERMTNAAYRQRERQDAAEARRKSSEANKDLRRQKAEIDFNNRKAKLVHNLRALEQRVTMNQRKGVFSKEESAMHRGKIGLGIGAIGSAGSVLELARVQGMYQDIVSYTNRATRAANAHYTAIQKSRFATSTLTGSIKNMAKGWLSVYALFEGATAFYRVGVAFDSMNASMLAASGDAKSAGENMQFLIETSQKLGTNLQSSVVGFNKLGIAAKAAGFTQEQTRDMFLAVSESVTAFTLSDEQQRNIFYALSQMASKTRISTEELQRQMGDYLPTAMQAMARSYTDFSGKQTDAGQLLKLIQDGKVMSKDVLPGFAKHLGILAREGGALAAAMEKVATQQKRFTTQTQLNVKDSFGESQGAFAFGWKQLTEAMKQAKPLFMVFGKVFGGAFAVVAVVARALAPVLGIMATGFERLFNVISGHGSTATSALAKNGNQLSLWERVALLSASGAYALAAAVYYVIGALEFLNEGFQNEENTFSSMTKNISSVSAAVYYLAEAIKFLKDVFSIEESSLNNLTSQGFAIGKKLFSEVTATMGGALMPAVGSGNVQDVLSGGISMFNGGATPWSASVDKNLDKKSPTNVTVEMNNAFNGASAEDGRSFAESFSSTLNSILTTGSY